MFTTWITKKNNKVDRVHQIDTDESPGPEWSKVPNDWNGNPEDKLSWFDENMRRIPDAELVERGIRKDNRGLWYSTETIGESKRIHDMDKEPGAGWTREKPLEKEAFQKWDSAANKFVVDTEKKTEAEHEKQIAGKKNAIEDAEKRIQRSVRAKLNGTATGEDEKYFQQITAEIDTLREELKQLSA
jgi:hypothetical protein